MDVITYIMEGKVLSYMREEEVTLLGCVAVVVLTILAILFISWWWIPFRAIFKPVLEKKYYYKRNRH